MTISNRYNLIKQLGEGGFGEVWLAEDTLTSTQVALKLYKVNSCGHDELFREYRLVAGLKHPNLLTASYVGRDDDQGISFLEMDYCRYGSLEYKIGDLTEKQIWQCIRDVAAGLQALATHTVFDEKAGKEVAAPVVHQDIKPANILIRSCKGNGEMTYAIADFGISKMNISQKSGSTLFSSAGTLSYMAPERFKSDYYPIVESDIWSLGAMLYELVEGKLPFASIEGLSGGNWLNQKGIDIPKIECSRISSRLCDTILACMSKKTQERPTAKQLLDCAEKELMLSPSMEKEESYEQTQEITHPGDTRPFHKDTLYWKSIIGWCNNKKIIRYGCYGLLMLVVFLVIFGLIRRTVVSPKVSETDCIEQKDGFRILGGIIDSISPDELGVLSDNVYFYKKDNSFFFIDSIGDAVAGGAAYDTFMVVSNVIVTGLFEKDSLSSGNDSDQKMKQSSAKNSRYSELTTSSESCDFPSKNRSVKKQDNRKKISKYGIISLSGKLLLPCVNKKIEHPSKGVHAYLKDSLWGWTSDTAVVIGSSFRNIKYAGIEKMLLCQCSADGCMEFYDSKGTKRLPNANDTKFYEAQPFANGYALVKTTMKNASFFIDKNGNTVWSPVDAGYDDCSSFYGNYSCVRKKIGDVRKVGLIDNKFNKVLPCEYEEIHLTEIGRNAAEVKKNGRWYIVSFDGKILANPKDSYYASIEGDFLRLETIIMDTNCL